MRKYWPWIAAAVVAVALVGGTMLLDSARDGKTDSPADAASEAKPSASQASTQAAGEPVPQRDETAQLADVMQPPAQTVAFIEPDRFTKDSKYAVVFVPYGTGPGPKGAALVISIEKSTPQGQIAKPFKFEGMNALVDTSMLKPDQAITKGGTYKGTITLALKEGMLVPTLSDVTKQ